MNNRQLGNSDMQITPVGFGSWAMGGTWGPQDDQDSISAIHAALDAGINWIDTAPVYGKGHSEEVVALAVSGRANKPYIFTKCGMVWDEKGEVTHRLTGDSIRMECEDSLRRLKTDVIDLYQVHWPKPDEDIEEAWTAMARLKEEGKVRWIAVSNFSVEQMKRAQKIAPITSLQPPYSMLRPAVQEEILPYTKDQGIGVIVYSPMLSGMLTGGMTKERADALPETDWRCRNKEFQEPRLSRNLALVDLLTEIGKRHDKPTAAVAIAWVLRNDAVTGAIVGGRSPRQVQGAAAALDFRLSDGEIQEIGEFIKAKVLVE